MSIRQAVRIVLNRSQESRNDDGKLLAEVLELCPGAKPDTAKRYRAFFQNKESKFLPLDPQVAKRRNRHKIQP